MDIINGTLHPTSFCTQQPQIGFKSNSRNGFKQPRMIQKKQLAQTQTYGGRPQEKLDIGRGPDNHLFEAKGILMVKLPLW
jgi:hypothetical protein